MGVLPVMKADISKPRDYMYLISKQYDNLSRQYKLVFTDNGFLYQDTTDKTLVRIRMWAEGEAAPYVDKWLDDPWVEGCPVLTFSNNMLSKVGKVTYEFILQEPGSMVTISTMPQNLNVEKSLTNYLGLIESNDFDVLSHLMAEAETIPDLIENIDTKREELEQLLITIQTDMSNYRSEFTGMQSDVDALILSVNNYINELTANVNITLTQANTAVSTANQLIDTADSVLTQATQKANEASNSALEAKRLVHGGVVPEDTEDNAEWYYRQTKNLKEQVDTASKLVIPRFYIDFDEGELCSETEAKGMDFWVDDGDFYGEEVI